MITYLQSLNFLTAISIVYNLLSRTYSLAIA